MTWNIQRSGKANEVSASVAADDQHVSSDVENQQYQSAKSLMVATLVALSPPDRQVIVNAFGAAGAGLQVVVNLG